MLWTDLMSVNKLQKVRASKAEEEIAELVKKAQHLEVELDHH